MSVDTFAIERAPGETDTALLLRVLRLAQGGWVAHCDSGLRMKANSRAADLRKKGHDVACRSFVAESKVKGDFRYRLAYDAELRVRYADPDEPAAEGPQLEETDTGQVRIAC